MIISLSGPQCVGKSTLVDEMVKHSFFEDFVFRGEIVRTLVKNLNIQISENGDDITQYLVMYNHYKNIVESKHRKMVTDRCAIDCHVYSEYLYYRNKISRNTMKESTLMVKNVAFEYDFIFYLPPEIPLVGDGVRSESNEFRNETHELFLKIFKEFNIPYIELNGSVEDRLKKIINTLK